MRLLDSNIIIYAGESGYESLRESLLDLKDLAASDISYLEVLGYNKYPEETQSFLEGFFSSIVVYPITKDIIILAVELRKLRKLSLGDSIIAATALTHHLPLLTNNEKDFLWIDGLSVTNPLRS